MQSRHAAVFRAMNGENDGQTTPFYLSEVPVYNANLEKGDYSVYQWPSTGGNDAAVVLNQTFNEDPLIGKLIRTRDFRKALSHGINRETINDNVFLGAGVIQSWAPHPSTPYYPGEEVANRNIEYNVDKANQLLDSIGLDKTDAQGFRLRTDAGRETDPILLDIIMYGESVMYGHTHDLQRHTLTKLGGTISAWSLGCLKDINNDEDWLCGRLTNWNHAFAIIDFYGRGQFTVDVVQIINGKCCVWGEMINGTK